MMKDKIKDSYKASKNFYDDVLTQGKWWSRLYIKVFWGGVDDVAIARKVLSMIPDDFSGKILDVPCGTLVFTAKKYQRLKKAELVCLDYSEDMLDQGKARAEKCELSNVKFMQGDVGNLPFEDGSFDVVMTMNGVHVFPDKEKAWTEMTRVIRPGGMLTGCYYIKGELKRGDWLVRIILSRKGWFTPPFDTKESLKARLEKDFEITAFETEGAMVSFAARKVRR